MSVQDTLSRIEEIKDNNYYPLTIGHLLDKLNQFDNDEPITLLNGNFLDGDWGSYRGDYSCLYIGEDDTDVNNNLVFDLKCALEEALRAGTMTGYKGGEYSINTHTDVYLARYGDLGEMVIDIQKINNEVILITKEY